MKINSLKLAYTTIFGLFTLYSTCHATCKVCSTASYGACTSKNTYALCLDGKTPSHQTGKCPKGTICTDKQGICLPEGSAEPGCPSSDCNECAGLFSCISTSMYAYCDSNGKKQMTATCENDEICSMENFIQSGSICAKNCDVKPTCSNIEVTTVAPIPNSYEDSCAGTTTNGYYPKIDDPTFVYYLYCEMLDNVMTSVLMKCPTGYFDPEKQKCTAKKPKTYI